MQFAGEWLLHADGVPRPMIRAEVIGADGNRYPALFLIDTGADQSVFSADFFQLLGFPVVAMPPGSTFSGIGGASDFTEADTILELTATDGSKLPIHGKYAAFTDPAAATFSILGRDILDLFDLIVSRQRDEIWLLRQEHYYQILKQ